MAEQSGKESPSPPPPPTPPYKALPSPSPGYTIFNEKKDLGIPRELVNAWNGNVRLEFQAAQYREEDDGSRKLEYVLEVIWEVRVRLSWHLWALLYSPREFTIHAFMRQVLAPEAPAPRKRENLACSSRLVAVVLLASCVLRCPNSPIPTATIEAALEPIPAVHIMRVSGKRVVSQ